MNGVDWGDALNVIAAVIAAASALFVAWQALETRRSVLVSRAGLEPARRMAVEAAKTRLDVRAPRLVVVAAPTDGEVARGGSRPARGEPGEPWPIGREFRRTEDDYQDLTLGAQFEVANEGDRSVVVVVNGPTFLLRPSSPPATISNGLLSVPLAPGDRCEFRLEESKALRVWAEAWEERATGNFESATIFGEVICSDPYDEGTVDRWKISAICYPVRPKPNDLAAWVLARRGMDVPIVVTFVSPQERQYYLSKQRDQALDTL